jgi:hypothetical protein
MASKRCNCFGVAVASISWRNLPIRIKSSGAAAAFSTINFWLFE